MVSIFAINSQFFFSFSFNIINLHEKEAEIEITQNLQAKGPKSITLIRILPTCIHLITFYFSSYDFLSRILDKELTARPFGTKKVRKMLN